MTKKREKLEIIHDILDVIRKKEDKIRRTHILYKSNLSHQMLNEYLNDLLSKNLIVELNEKNKPKTYKLTQKGYNYLKDYSLIKGFIESYGLD